MTISRQAIEEIFAEHGMAAAAVLAVPGELPAEGLDTMLKLGVGDMTYMHDHRSLRLNPRTFFPPARSIIAAVMDYSPSPGDEQQNGAIKRARYARGKDYHNVFRKQLRKAVRSLLPEDVPYRIAVDSAPVLERTLAARAGLGWIGKNGLLLIPGKGSYHFLGFVFVGADLQQFGGGKEADRCGSCSRCISACPTGAIVANRFVDSTRCISYFTIEHKGVIPREMAEKFDGWWFGCDICQEACPWNRFAPETGESRYLGEDDEAQLLNLGEDEYDTYFAGRAVRRASFAQFQRNLMVALFSLGRIEEARTIARRSTCELVEQQALELGISS